jgi:hypothetical protein
MTDAIPREVLEAEQLRFERHCASVLLAFLAETGQSFADIDARLDQKPGYAKKFIVGLMEGKTGTMKEAVQIAFALGYRIEIRAQDLLGIRPLEATASASQSPAHLGNQEDSQ